MKKFRSSLYLLIAGLLILVFSFVLGYLLEKHLPLETDEALILYIITKGIASLVLVWMVIYLVFLKKDPANLVIQFSATLVYQFLPLLVRFLMTGDEPRLILSVIVIFLVTIIYFAVFFAVDVLNLKVKQAEKELKGRTIPVVDENSYNDENGRFVSAAGKDKVR